MNPATIGLILQGLSLAGGIFGKKRKYIDPAMLDRMYGSTAIGQHANELVNVLQNSPYGQALLQQAAEQGQQLQTGLAAARASTGQGPSGGVNSGASDFGVAAAPQAAGALQRGVKAGLWQTALPIASDLVSQERALAVGNNADQNANPTDMWGRIGGSAASALAHTPSPGGGTDWAAILKKYTNPSNAVNDATTRTVNAGMAGW